MFLMFKLEERFDETEISFFFSPSSVFLEVSNGFSWIAEPAVSKPSGCAIIYNFVNFIIHL